MGGPLAGCRSRQLEVRRKNLEVRNNIAVYTRLASSVGIRPAGISGCGNESPWERSIASRPASANHRDSSIVSVREVVVPLEFRVPPDARFRAVQLRDASDQRALQIRHPAATSFVQLHVVEMRVADERVTLVFVRHESPLSFRGENAAVLYQRDRDTAHAGSRLFRVEPPSLHDNAFPPRLAVRAGVAPGVGVVLCCGLHSRPFGIQLGMDDGVRTDLPASEVPQPDVKHHLMTAARAQTWPTI